MAELIANRVTVIIPSYNHGLYIEEAINSVLAQQHPPGANQEIELIVIDDGSTDDTAIRVNNLLKKTPDAFRFLQKSNSGLIHSLATGLEMASGEFFCQLASDDFLPPNSIARRIHFFQQHNSYSAVFTDGFTVLKDKVTEDRFVGEKHRRLFEQKDPIPAMLKGTLPVFATGLFRTKQLQEAGGFDHNTFRYYEDLDTPIRLALTGKIGFINEPLFFRREHDSNVSRATSHIRSEKIKAYEKLLQTEGMEPYRSLLRNRIIRSQITLGKHIAANGAHADEMETFKRGWPYAWRNPKLGYLLLRHGIGR